MVIKTPFKNRIFKGEINNLPSKTIPDQAMSIPELIRRYASGLPLGAPKVPMYAENPEEDLLFGKDFRTLDLSEQHDIVKNAKREYEETISRLRNTDKQTERGSKQPEQTPSE